MLEQSFDNLVLPDCPFTEEEHKVSHPPTVNPETPPPSPTPSKKRGRKPFKESPDRLRRTKSNQQKNPNQNFGHWSLQENKRYHWFLQIHHSHFLNKHLRRMDKIFKAMAVFVGTRQAEQCRSHHQKMQKKYNHSICLILINLRRQHYNSESENLLIEDIRFNNVEIGEVGEPLLTDTFLLERIKNGPIEQDLEMRGEEGQIKMEELKEEEEEKDETEKELGLRDMGCEWDRGMNVDELLFDFAPHNHFQMI